MRCTTLSFLIHISGLVLVLQAAHATSRSQVGQTQSSNSSALAAYCEITAEFVSHTHVSERVVFKQRTHDETRVSWVFDIGTRASVGGGACPAGARFELAIRGAEFVAVGGVRQYVYPLDISEPAPDSRWTVHARAVRVRDPRNGNERDEWLVTDWGAGFAALRD